MAGADVDRSYTLSCTKHRADSFAVIEQRSDGARSLAGLPVRATQPRLGTAYGRQADDKSQVRCEAEPARVSDTLTVAENALHGCHYAAQDRQRHWNFPKRQQPWNVRKRERRACRASLQHLASAHVPYDGDGQDVVAEIGAIDSGDSARYWSRSQPHVVTQLALQHHGFLRTKVPSMGCSGNFHNGLRVGELEQEKHGVAQGPAKLRA